MMTKPRPFILRSRSLRRVARVQARRRAFTVLEMVVALAIFLVLLTAIFVPIKLAGDLSGVGISRANTQQAAIDGIRQIKSDINKAIVIMPNERTVGITDVYPYTANGGLPYRRDASGYVRPTTQTAEGRSEPDGCRQTGTPATYSPAPNTARLDLILPANNSDGTLDPALRNSNVLVSYYARRLDMTKAFDPIENPVALFRAQIPFQYSNAAGIQSFMAWDTPTSPNANLANGRFTLTPCDSRSLQWLTMNQYGEFDLTKLALPPANTPGAVPSTTETTFGSHQLVLPRDTVLLTPYAAPDTDDNQNPGMSLVPDTTFICSDANKDGKIDTVTIQLSVGQYDENSVNRRTVPTPVGAPAGAPPPTDLQPQIARTLTETVSAPNVK